MERIVKNTRRHIFSAWLPGVPGNIAGVMICGIWVLQKYNSEYDCKLRTSAGGIVLAEGELVRVGRQGILGFS